MAEQSRKTPFRLLPPERVADTNQIIPLQLKKRDAARLLGYSVSTIERLLRAGELESTGRGKLLRIPYASILAYIARNTNEAA
jgi:excisionase family DNA binding protein